MDFEKLLSEIRYELIADYPYNKHALNLNMNYKINKY